MSDITFQNPLDVLKVLLDSSNNKQQDSLNAQQNTAQTQNAYQKGVNKALSEQGYKHGADALAAGVDPTDIANHDKMQPQGQSSPNQTLSNLVTPNTAAQAQAMPNIPDGGIIGGLLKAVGFGMTPEMMNSVSNYSATKQRVDAGQPNDIAVPLAQAAEINQKIAGAVPLQPADIIKLNVDTYGAALKANQDAYANSNTEVANLTKTLDILQQGRSTWGKAFGGNTDIMNSLKQVIAAKTAENQKISKNQNVLMNNPPSINNPNGNKDTNKVGKYSFTKG